MTGLEARSKVLEYLIEHDSITYENIEFLIKGEKNMPEARVAVLCAINELTTSGVLYLNPIASTTDYQSLIWVLSKPLILHNQKVEIDGNTALQIASIINAFSETVNDSSIRIDPLNIDNKSISILLEILALYSEKEDKE